MWPASHSLPTLALDQGCPNYSLRANCSPRTIFNWHAADSKNIIEYVPHMKQALDYMYISVLTLVALLS